MVEAQLWTACNTRTAPVKTLWLWRVLLRISLGWVPLLVVVSACILLCFQPCSFASNSADKDIQDKLGETLTEV